MIRIDDIKRVYFLGIGGIGMSALARYFLHLGKKVGGYDRTETALTRKLTAEGAEITYAEDPAGLPADLDLAVYTPAVPGTSPLLGAVRERGVLTLKRSEVLQSLTSDTYNICVAGTHGKTTVSALIAHVLHHSGRRCNAFLGGIAVNYETNFLGGAEEITVVEADEYDRSFLRLDPDIAVVTAMDPDHLDVYGTEAAMKDAFQAFTTRIRSGGLLVHHHRIPEQALQCPRRIRYDLDRPEAEAAAEQIRIEQGAYRFDVRLPGERLSDLQLPMGGRHNVENAVAAVAVCRELDVPGSSIRSALEQFRGVRRRFEFRVRMDQRVYIDDYAHHPQELEALIRGARELFPGWHCLILFQPHLYSRTRDLAEGFARALERADEILLLPVYPARELPVKGVESHLIADRIKQGAKILSMAECRDWLKNRLRELQGPLLLISAGAGDIDKLAEPLTELMTKY